MKESVPACLFHSFQLCIYLSGIYFLGFRGFRKSGRGSNRERERERGSELHVIGKITRRAATSAKGGGGGADKREKM